MLHHTAAKLLQMQVQLSTAEIEALLEHPPKAEMGDLAFPCFALAKMKRQAPPILAKELAEQLQAAGSQQGIHIEATGGYVNLKFDPARHSAALLNRALSPTFGKLAIGQGQRVVIDMSAPNIAKPFGIGHLRSTMIGNALMNIYRAAGYEPISINHLGDWGTQFGKLIAAYKHWGDDEALHQSPITESLKLYVRFHEEAEQTPELETEAREWFRKLEQGDEETLRLWRYFVDESMVEFNRVYDRLQVEFDHVLGESFYNDKMQAVVQRLEESGLLEESDGAMVVRLDNEGLPPCLILKSDGTTIYPTRDLATAIYRKEVLKADKLLYVVGAEQQLHFKQVFAVLRKMGYEWASSCEHIPFGLMTMNGKKMSTRRGQVVFLNEVLDEAVNKSLDIVQANRPDASDPRAVAEAVGVGAIVFGDLKNNRMLTVDFNLDEALRFEGETGAYLQYTYARASRLLEKAGWSDDSIDTTYQEADGKYLNGSEAWACLKLLCTYESTLSEALRVNEPSIVARMLLEAAKTFNRFYHQERIMNLESREREVKLGLVKAAADLLKQGLNLLGVAAPKEV
ncbi:arginine--tRNA ligase [Paenibacillus marinisediminis]